jgi:hypothetical protein
MSSIISTCDCERLGCRFLTSQQKRQAAAYCPLLLFPSVPPTNMPLLYADALQTDNDICNLLTALRIGDGPQSPAPPAPDHSSAVTHSWPIIAENQDNNRTPIHNACDLRSTQQVDRVTIGTLCSAAQVPSNISPADGPRQPSRNPLPSASIDLSGK